MAQYQKLVGDYGESLVHLEDLKPPDLLAFMSSSKILLSEKVDGTYLCIGEDREGNYITTKRGDKYLQTSDIPNIYYLDEIRDISKHLLTIPLRRIFREMFPGTFPASVKLIGEVIPTHDHNIVQYDKEKIGQGVFVLFQVELDGEKYPMSWLESRILCVQMANHTKVLFVAKDDLCQEAIEPDPDFKGWLENMLTEHKDLLVTTKKPLTKEQRQVRAGYLDRIFQRTVAYKQLILATYPKSLFGEEVEGYVALSNNYSHPVKIVDRYKFGARKSDNCWFIDLMKKAYAKLRRETRNSPGDVRKHVKNFLFVVGTIWVLPHYFSIHKKYEQTIRHKQMVMNRIEQFNKEPSDERLVQMILNHETGDK